MLVEPAHLAQGSGCECGNGGASARLNVFTMWSVGAVRSPGDDPSDPSLQAERFAEGEPPAPRTGPCHALTIEVSYCTCMLAGQMHPDSQHPGQGSLEERPPWAVAPCHRLHHDLPLTALRLRAPSRKHASCIGGHCSLPSTLFAPRSPGPMRPVCRQSHGRDAAALTWTGPAHTFTSRAALFSPQHVTESTSHTAQVSSLETSVNKGLRHLSNSRGHTASTLTT